MKAPLITIAALAACALAAEGIAAAEMAGQEKCFSIVKAGKNQCQSKALACAGHAKSDNEADAWIWVPHGTCDRLVGGLAFAGKGGSAGYNRADLR